MAAGSASNWPPLAACTSMAPPSAESRTSLLLTLARRMWFCFLCWLRVHIGGLMFDPSTPDAPDGTGRPNVSQRIVVEQQQVGPVAWLESAAIGQAEVARGQHRRRPQHIQQGQPGVGEQLQLPVQALAVRYVG